MENSKIQTIERLFNIAVTQEDIRNFTQEEVLQMLREDGELYISDDNPVDIVVAEKITVGGREFSMTCVSLFRNRRYSPFAYFTP